MKISYLRRLFDWRPDKLRGERSRNENVVVLKRLFKPEEFDTNPAMLIEYQRDLREECSKFGHVKRVVIYDVISGDSFSVDNSKSLRFLWLFVFREMKKEQLRSFSKPQKKPMHVSKYSMGAGLPVRRSRLKPGTEQLSIGMQSSINCQFCFGF